jgi:hypothetical protein
MHGKLYKGFRCTKCWKFRSAKNALAGGEFCAATAGADEARSFFATVSMDEKSHTKLSVKSALAVIYF